MSSELRVLDESTSSLLKDFIFPKESYYNTWDDLSEQIRDSWIKLMTEVSRKSSFIKDMTTAQVLFDYTKWIAVIHQLDTISFTEEELQSYITCQVLSNIKYSLKQPNYKDLIASRDQINTLYKELVLISEELDGCDLAQTNIKTKLDLINNYLDEIRTLSSGREQESLSRIVEILRMPSVKSVNPFKSLTVSNTDILSHELGIVTSNPSSPIDSSMDGVQNEDLTDERISKQRKEHFTSLTSFNIGLFSSQPLNKSNLANSIPNTSSFQNTQNLSSFLRQSGSKQQENTILPADIETQPSSYKPCTETTPPIEKAESTALLHSSNDIDTSNSNDAIDLANNLKESVKKIQQEMSTNNTDSNKEDENIYDATKNLITSTQNLIEEHQKSPPKATKKKETNSNEKEEIEEQVARNQTSQMQSSNELSHPHQPQPISCSSRISKANETTDINLQATDTQIVAKSSVEKHSSDSQDRQQSYVDSVVASSNDTIQKGTNNDFSEIRRFFAENSDLLNKINDRKEQLMLLFSGDSIFTKLEAFNQFEAKLAYIQKQLQSHINHLFEQNSTLNKKFETFQNHLIQDRQNAIYNLNQLKVDMVTTTTQLNTTLDSRYQTIIDKLNAKQNEIIGNLVTLDNQIMTAVTIYASFFDSKILSISESIAKIFTRLEHISSLEKDNARVRFILGTLGNEVKELKYYQNQSIILNTKVTMIENRLKMFESNIKNPRAANHQMPCSIDSNVSIEDDKVSEIKTSLSTTRSNVKTLAIQMNKLREDGIKYRNTNNSNADTALNRVEKLKKSLESFVSSFDIDKLNSKLEKQSEEFLELEYQQTKLIDENKKLRSNVEQLNESNIKNTAQTNELQALARRMNQQMCQQAEILRVQSKKIETLEKEIIMQKNRRDGNRHVQVPLNTPRSSSTAPQPGQPTLPNITSTTSAATPQQHHSNTSYTNSSMQSPSVDRKRPTTAIPGFSALKIPKLFRSNLNEDTS